MTETVRRLYVRQVNTLGGPEWWCEAGQLDQPIGCERHRDHHWCETCKGYYGVPHDGIHEGPNATWADSVNSARAAPASRPPAAPDRPRSTRRPRRP